MSRVSSTYDLGQQEQRAALWLYGWSLQSAAHQRYQSRRFLEELERAGEAD